MYSANFRWQGNFQSRSYNKSSPWVAACTTAGKDSKVLKARSKWGFVHRGREGISTLKSMNHWSRLQTAPCPERPAGTCRWTPRMRPNPHTTVLRPSGKTSDAVSFSVSVWEQGHSPFRRQRIPYKERSQHMQMFTVRDDGKTARHRASHANTSEPP